MIQKTVFRKQTHRIREQNYGCPGGEEWEEEMGREFGINRYTLLYIKYRNKEQLNGTGNSAQSHAAAWIGGEFGGEQQHVYVWLSRHAFYLKLSQPC